MTHKTPFRDLSLALTIALGLIIISLWSLGGAPVVFAAGITVNTTDDEDNSDGDCSLREAIRAANIDAAVDGCAPGSGPDTIQFSLTTPAVITLNQGELVIDKDLTIQGPGAGLLAVNGNNASRVFNIDRIIPVTITGLTVRNGNTNSSGGGLHSEGQVTLIDSVFVDNAASAAGGALDVEGTLTLSNTNVLSNIALGDGGGVNGFGALTTISGGRFENNRAGNVGGGLNVYHALIISGAQFISNTAQSYGGSAFAWEGLVLTNTHFERNTAVNGGVAFALGDVSISGSSFASNTAAARFGALWVNNGDVTMSGSSFVSNTAATEFGAMWIVGDLLMTNTDFISNTAGTDYGAVQVVGEARITGGEFTGNVAQAGSAGALEAGGPLWLTGTQFIANQAASTGGAIEYAGSEAQIVGALFARNHASGNGGAINIQSNLTMSNTDLLSNTTAGQGGGVNGYGALTSISGGRFENNYAGMAGGLYAAGTLVLNGTQFISNTAQNFAGGAFTWLDATISNAYFERNVAQDYSVGAMYVAGDLLLTGSSFISNTAGQRDGAVWAGGDARLSDGTFRGNVAQTGRAGALDVGGALWLTRTHFTTNRSGDNGGAIEVGGNLTMSGSDILSNTAGGQGGGVNGYGGWVTVSGGRFENNRADAVGGLYAAGSLIISGTQFISNTAAQQGGAVWAVGDARLTNGLFRDNAAKTGSAGALDAGSALWLTATHFIANRAGADGGAIDVQGTLTMSGSDVLSNSTVGLGGGIWGNGGLNSITGGRFENNLAGDMGGGLYASGDIVLSGTQFISNTAQNYGGGILTWGRATVEGAYFVRNATRKYSVGAMYVDGDLLLNGSSFISNTAKQQDGAVWAAGDAHVSDGAFRGNVAQTGSAGGLDVGGALWLTRTQFIANRAGTDGGALVLAGSDGRLVNALFAGNDAAGDGGAIYLAHSGSLELLHATIATPTRSAKAAILVEATGSVTLANSIVASYSHGIRAVSGAVYEDYNLFYQTLPAAGAVVRGGHSFSGPPLFADPPGDDYHLLAGSWALNSGAEVVIATDVDGDPRPGGGAIDVGFDETTHLSDAAIAKTVSVDPAPGAVITYTITFSNSGETPLFGVVISDTVPEDVYQTNVISSGAVITATGVAPNYRWQVSNLAHTQRGVITITGLIVNPVDWGIFTNTAQIGTTSPDLNIANDIASVMVTVGNAPPVAVSDTYTTAEDIAISLNPLTNDVDDNPLYIAAFTQPSKGMVVFSGTTRLIYTPTLNFNGLDSFSYTISDGALTGTAAITLTIVPVNDRPVITEGETITVTMSEDSAPTPFDLALNAGDVDGDLLAWSILEQAPNGTAAISATSGLNNTGAIIAYAPQANYNGQDSFVVQVSDGLLSDTISIDLLIEPVDDAPFITNGEIITVTMSEDGAPTPFDLTLNGDLADDDLLSWTIDGQAAHGAAAISYTLGISNAGAVIAYDPEANYYGQDSFTVQISDGLRLDSAGVMVIIEPVNDAPVAADDIALLMRTPGGDIELLTPGQIGTLNVAGSSAALNVLHNDTDIENDPLQVSAISSPLYGDFSLQPSSFSLVYTPSTTFSGLESLTYTATDGNLSVSAALSVTVANGKLGGIGGETLTAVYEGAGGDITITVEIPAGVVDAGHFALIYDEPGQAGDPPPAGYEPAVALFTLAAYLDGQLLDRHHSFRQPLSLTVEYDNVKMPEIGGSEESLTIYFWDGSAWSGEGITIAERDIARNRLVVRLDHATEFGLFRRGGFLYLPLVMRNFAPGPDLVVESLTATSDGVQVVIANRGNSPVVDAFWVDVYLDPETPPTAANQTWQMLGNQGLVWGVTAEALPLAQGQVLTLTVGDPYYAAEVSNVTWPLAAGTPVYVQVDSANSGTDYGAVLEDHELIGGPYNNIGSTSSTGKEAGRGPLVTDNQQPAVRAGLPGRQ